MDLCAVLGLNMYGNHCILPPEEESSPALWAHGQFPTPIPTLPSPAQIDWVIDWLIAVLCRSNIWDNIGTMCTLLTYLWCLTPHRTQPNSVLPACWPSAALSWPWPSTPLSVQVIRSGIRGRNGQLHEPFATTTVKYRICKELDFTNGLIALNRSDVVRAL